MLSNPNSPASLPFASPSTWPVTTLRRRRFALLIGVLSEFHAVPTTFVDRTPTTTRDPLTAGRAATVPFDPDVRSGRSVAPSAGARTVRPRPAATTIKLKPRILVIAASLPSCDLPTKSSVAKRAPDHQVAKNLHR